MDSRKFVKIINFDKHEAYKSLINKWIITKIIDNKFYNLKNNKIKVAILSNVLIKDTKPLNF